MDNIIFPINYYKKEDINIDLDNCKSIRDIYKIERLKVIEKKT